MIRGIKQKCSKERHAFSTIKCMYYRSYDGLLLLCLGREEAFQASEELQYGYVVIINRNLAPSLNKENGILMAYSG